MTPIKNTIESVRAAWAGRPIEVDRGKGDGETTCLWHRQHEYYLAHVVPLLPACDICGGEVDARAERHELCRLRKLKGLPIERLSVVRSCPCARCEA